MPPHNDGAGTLHPGHLPVDAYLALYRLMALEQFRKQEEKAGKKEHEHFFFFEKETMMTSCEIFFSQEKCQLSELLPLHRTNKNNITQHNLQMNSPFVINTLP